MDTALLIDFLSATVRIATPILMAAMGGILIERSGTFAVGLEGMMLSGAFSGVVGAFLSGSIVTGLLAACFGGLVFGVIIAIATTKFDTEHMVTGLAANLLALGLTSFVLRTVVGRGQAPVIHIPLLQPVPIPYLADLPVVGALLFHQPPLTYLAFLSVIAIAIFLRRTRGGLLLTPHRRLGLPRLPLRRHARHRRRHARPGHPRRGVQLRHGVNDAGQVAGTSSITGDATYHAFRYDGTPGPAASCATWAPSAGRAAAARHQQPGRWPAPAQSPATRPTTPSATTARPGAGGDHAQPGNPRRGHTATASPSTTRVP